MYSGPAFSQGIHMQLHPIGILHSCFKAKFGTPRQGKVAPQTQGYIEIHKAWDPQNSMRELAGFSHVWVMFWFHDNKNLGYLATTKPPRLGGRAVGVFATRSPLRPNPLGLSLVKIERIEGARLHVSGIDIIDGTPVIDIKPYIHSYDSVEGSRSGWLEEVTEPKLDVDFSDDAIKVMASHPNPHLQEILTEILASDIRNRSDKREIRAGKRLGFYFEDLNVVFRVLEGGVVVERIEHASEGQKLLP